MKSIVPYTKEIPFGSKIAEICSISLEHELDYQDTEILGNFIVSGEYRSHEISVNTEHFLYKLPFSVDVMDSVIRDSIDFEITNFTYEVLNGDTLKVDIEFCVTAEEVEVEEVEVTDLNRESLSKEIEEMFSPVKEDENLEPFQEEQTDDREENLKEEEKIIEEEEETMIETNNEEVEMNQEVITEEERMDEMSEQIIMTSAESKNDEFATYHIHIVGNGDTLESICASYQTDVATLKNYNTVDVLNAGDKIIIPCIDE